MSYVKYCKIMIKSSSYTYFAACCDGLNQNELNYLLRYACQFNHAYNTIGYLIKRGANLDNYDNCSDKPLFIACQTDNNLNNIKYLIKAGADPNFVSDTGNNLLLFACMKSTDKRTAKWLIKLGLDVNQCNTKGNTPLIYACQLKNSNSLVRVLVNNGADINHVNNKGQTPLYFAIAFNKGQVDIIKYLIKKGANVDLVFDYPELQDDERDLLQTLCQQNIKKIKKNAKSAVYI